MEPLTGTDPAFIAGYETLGRLGAGGMGVVYLGRAPSGRLVAVKVIRARFAGDLEFRARFHREVAAARVVSGAFTAPVIDADPDADQPWLVTAYVAGLALDEAVRDFGPLPVQSVRTLAGGLAEALRSIHAVGLVHRDFKPSNMLLAADGPRVIDFGISRALDASKLSPRPVSWSARRDSCPPSKPLVKRRAPPQTSSRLVPYWRMPRLGGNLLAAMARCPPRSTERFTPNQTSLAWIPLGCARLPLPAWTNRPSGDRRPSRCWTSFWCPRHRARLAPGSRRRSWPLWRNACNSPSTCSRFTGWPLKRPPPNGDGGRGERSSRVPRGWPYWPLSVRVRWFSSSRTRYRPGVRSGQACGSPPHRCPRRTLVVGTTRKKRNWPARTAVLASRGRRSGMNSTPTRRRICTRRRYERGPARNCSSRPLIRWSPTLLFHRARQTLLSLSSKWETSRPT